LVWVDYLRRVSTVVHWAISTIPTS
jgi:hypothetical protein